MMILRTVMSTPRGLSCSDQVCESKKMVFKKIAELGTRSISRTEEKGQRVYIAQVSGK